MKKEPRKGSSLQAAASESPALWRRPRYSSGDYPAALAGSM